MKVLLQYWRSWKHGGLYSISKNKEQLDATITEVSGDEEDQTVPHGTATEITLNDDSVFSEMVQSRTVFLHDDEMAEIYDAMR